MCELSQKLLTGLSIVIVGLVVCGSSLAQELNKPAANQPEKIDQTQDFGEMSLDALKEMHSMGMSPGDNTTMKHLHDLIERYLKLIDFLSRN